MPRYTFLSASVRFGSLHLDYNTTMPVVTIITVFTCRGAPISKLTDIPIANTSAIKALIPMLIRFDIVFYT